ncbi:DJ-1 family glyoxalase III [Mesoplasma photuris]|uniref:DJ-1 family glyoxalase III n=1 Tax=Mesoplasma photuris TaxID=217731 RepID=UPI00068CBAF6|nr:DJ-1 family glyoxalase III [Mesoplasma photuris]
MEKRVAIFLGTAFEELEAVTIIDVLRRGGIKVDMISIENTPTVTSARNITMHTDILINDIKLEDYEMFILPGGSGVNRILENEQVVEIFTKADQMDKLVGAICAGPQVLAKAIEREFNVTHFPGCDQFMENKKENMTVPFITDKNITTGRSAGHSLDFSLEVLKILKGEETAKNVREQFKILN